MSELLLNQSTDLGAAVNEPEIMTRRDRAPEWVIAISDQVDTLIFTTAFEKFLPNAEMIFGTESVRGAEAMKSFFRKIDTPLSSKHEIFEVWSGSGRTYVLGQANLIKKAQPKEQFFCPFQWMFYDDPVHADMLRLWRVTAGPVDTSGVV